MNMNILEVYAPNIPAENTAIQQCFILFGSHQSKTIFSSIPGKCNKEFWSKWFPRRVKHNCVVWSLWLCVWLLGTWPLGRPFSEGWKFVLPVTCAARVGFSLAWMFITNFTHSLSLGFGQQLKINFWKIFLLESCNFSQVWYFCILNLDPKSIAWIGFTTSQNSGSSRPWNKFLASDPGRNRPILHNLMALAVGGKHRWNEMLYDTQPHHQITPKILRGLSYICRSRVFLG